MSFTDDVQTALKEGDTSAWEFWAVLGVAVVLVLALVTCCFCCAAKRRKARAAKRQAELNKQDPSTFWDEAASPRHSVVVVNPAGHAPRGEAAYVRPSTDVKGAALGVKDGTLVHPKDQRAAGGVGKGALPVAVLAAPAALLAAPAAVHARRDSRGEDGLKKANPGPPAYLQATGLGAEPDSTAMSASQGFMLEGEFMSKVDSAPIQEDSVLTADQVDLQQGENAGAYVLAASDGSIGAARDAGQQAQTPVVPSEGLTSGSVTAPSASIIDALGLTCARLPSSDFYAANEQPSSSQSNRAAVSANTLEALGVRLWHTDFSTEILADGQKSAGSMARRLQQFHHEVLEIDTNGGVTESQLHVTLGRVRVPTCEEVHHVDVVRGASPEIEVMDEQGEWLSIPLRAGDTISLAAQLPYRIAMPEPGYARVIRAYIP